MSTARRRATYQDVVEAPEHLVAELIDGELITSPRPASPHALAASAMSMDLSPFHQPPGAAGKPGGWWILYEPELHFGTMSSCLISRVGGASACPNSPTSPGSR